MVICNRKSENIKCDSGIIKIKNASYGRQDTQTCLHPTMSNTNCHSPSSFYNVTDLCESKYSCRLTAESNQFEGDPCFGIFKYLGVQYTCQGK